MPNKKAPKILTQIDGNEYRVLKRLFLVNMDEINDLTSTAWINNGKNLEAKKKQLIPKKKLIIWFRVFFIDLMQNSKYC